MRTATVVGDAVNSSELVRLTCRILDEVCVGPVLPKNYMILHVKFSNGKQYYYAANPADFYLSGM